MVGTSLTAGLGLDPEDAYPALLQRRADSLGLHVEIVNAGLILQVDDAVLANMYDELMQHGQKRYRQWAELRVDAAFDFPDARDVAGGVDHEVGVGEVVLDDLLVAGPHTYAALGLVLLDQPGNDIPVLLSTCRAERVEGGYRLTGRKQFGSNGPAWRWLGAHAIDADAPGGPQCFARPPGGPPAARSGGPGRASSRRTARATACAVASSRRGQS